MSATYAGILRVNQIEWTTAAPPKPPAEGVRVQVTLLDAVANQGQQMAAALARLAASHAVQDIADLASWERETRQDRELPGKKGVTDDDH
jgi:hypothetical protein